MTDSLDARRPPGSDDEFTPRCVIPPGEASCNYSISGGGVTRTGSFSIGQQPQPQPPDIVNEEPATLDVAIVESIRISSNDASRQGFNSPSHARTRVPSGDSWINVRSISQSGEGSEASHVLGESLGTQLVAQDFGFRIPLASDVVSISVEIDRSVFGGEITEETVSLIVCGVGAQGAAGVFYNGFYNIFVLDSEGTITQSTAIPGLVFGADPSGNFYGIGALDSVLRKFAPDFTPIWEADLYSVGSVDSEGRVFVGDEQQTSAPLNVYRIDPDDGTVLWTTDIYDAVGGGTQRIDAMYAAGDKVMAFLISGFVRHAVVLGVDGNIIDTLPVDGGSTPGFAILGADGHVYGFNPGEAGGELSRLTAPTWSVFIGVVIGHLVYDPASGALYASGGSAVQRYDSSDGSQDWSVSLTDADSVGVDGQGGVYAVFFDEDAFTVRIRKLNSANGATVWTSSGLGDEDTNGLLLPYGVSTSAPVNLLLDEGYETSEGVYSCALTPLTITSSNSNGVSAFLADASIFAPQEVNDISFGVVYSARGSGIVGVDAVRVAVDYAGAFGESLPAKRTNGLSGVAISRTGRRVAVGVNGKVLYSDDGTMWLAADSGTVATLLDVVWANDHFVAVGRGVIVESYDGNSSQAGMTWTRVQAPPETLYEVMYNRATEQIIAIGENGVQAAPDAAGNWLTRYR